MTCEDDDGAGVAMGGPLGAVMVDYMCQLDQVMGSPDCWLKIQGFVYNFVKSLEILAVLPEFYFMLCTSEQTKL